MQVRMPAKAQGSKRWAPHAAAACLFNGMVLSAVLPALFFPSRDLALMMMIGILVITLAVATWMRMYGAWRPPLTPFGVLLVIATASGIPGLLLHPSPETWAGLMFFAALAVRNFLCFTALPRSVWVLHSRYEEIVLKWVLIASAIVTVGSLRAAWLTNTSLYSSVRLTGEGNNWLNANSTGVYAATGALAAAMLPSLPAWMRMALVAAHSYVLLLSQSRASMLALVAGVLTYLVLAGRKLGAILVTVLAAAGYMAAPTLIDELRTADFGQIRALIERTDAIRADPWSGRERIIRDAWQRVQESPLVGYGFQTGGFENGFLSVGIESGLVGLTAYLAIVAVVIRRSVRLLRLRHRLEMQYLARCTLCLTAFTLAHSLGEKTAPVFQIGLTASNAWAILAGLVFVHTSRLARTSGPKAAGFEPAICPAAARARGRVLRPTTGAQGMLA